MKFLNRVWRPIAPSWPKRRSRGETTVKPMPYREIDLQIGRTPTGYCAGALPSPAAGGVSGVGASWLHPQTYNPAADGGWRT